MIRRPQTVRLATPQDIEPLYWMLMRDLAVDNSLGIPVSPTMVLDWVYKCCRGDGAIAGVIDSPNGIVASTGVVASHHLFSDAWKLQQIWLFVTPQARKGARYADKLFQFCLWHKGDMSSRLGYDVPLEISVVSRKRLPAKLRLWGRYGEMIGGVFWTRGENEHRQQFDNQDLDATLP